jgi:hypothetical protein
LYNSEEMKQVFSQPPIVAFRGDKNFKDILVHKKHNVFYNKHNKCESCGKNCALCKHIMTDNKFYGTDNAEYKFKGYINCKSTSVIYSVYCKRCSKVLYVGQTGDTFYQRMLLNFSMIRTKKYDTIAEHFYLNGH